MPARPDRRAFLIASAGLLLGCGGGAPRKPVPYNERYRTTNKTRELFVIRSTQDEWHELPPIKKRLEDLGGVIEVGRDFDTGKFYVEYMTTRTTRDKIRVRIIEIGRELGRKFDPMFDDR